MIYNKTADVVTFQMEMKRTKKLVKKLFAQIISLGDDGPYEVPFLNQILWILNEMG